MFCSENYLCCTVANCNIMTMCIVPNSYAGINTDPELKCPRGTGRVSFDNQNSYLNAINTRFVHVKLAHIDKRVQYLSSCLHENFTHLKLRKSNIHTSCRWKWSRMLSTIRTAATISTRHAPHFCSNVNCLQYYCEPCWRSTIHQMIESFRIFSYDWVTRNQTHAITDAVPCQLYSRYHNRHYANMSQQCYSAFSN